MPQKDEHGKPKKYSFDMNGHSITVLEVKPQKIVLNRDEIEMDTG